VPGSSLFDSLDSGPSLQDESREVRADRHRRAYFRAEDLGL
jgi:hypothetical protein